MKIKALTSCSGINFTLTAGEEKDIADEIALDLVNAGYASVIKSKGDNDGSKGRSTTGK